MDLNDLAIILSCIADIWLGFFIFSKNRKSTINVSFSLIAFSMAVWAFTVFMNWNTNQYSLLFWGNTAFLGPSFIPGLLVYFALAFPHGRKVPTKLQTIIIFAPAVFLCILAFLNLIYVVFEFIGYIIFFVKLKHLFLLRQFPRRRDNFLGFCTSRINDMWS